MLTYLLAAGVLSGVALSDGARALGILICAQLVGVLLPFLALEPRRLREPTFLDLSHQVVMALSTAGVLSGIGLAVLGFRWWVRRTRL